MGWQGTDTPNTHEKSTKNQKISELYRCGKCEAMDKSVECLHCHEVKSEEYFELLDMNTVYKCCYSESLKLPAK